MNKNQEAQIVILKNESEEKDKIITKATKRHADEVKELKSQQMLTSENLRSAVLEREVLRENDRILLNTFDMMKIYIDQMKEKYSNNLVGAATSTQCVQCDVVARSADQLLEHMETTHGRKYFNCQECQLKFESKQLLKSHIESNHNKNMENTHENHESNRCKSCDNRTNKLGLSCAKLSCQLGFC